MWQRSSSECFYRETDSGAGCRLGDGYHSVPMVMTSAAWPESYRQQVEIKSLTLTWREIDIWQLIQTYVYEIQKSLPCMVSFRISLSVGLLSTWDPLGTDWPQRLEVTWQWQIDCMSLCEGKLLCSFLHAWPERCRMTLIAADRHLLAGVSTCSTAWLGEIDNSYYNRQEILYHSNRHGCRWTLWFCSSLSVWWYIINETERSFVCLS